MPNGEETVLSAAKAFLDRQTLGYEEQDEQYCTKLSIKHHGQRAFISVYNSGKIVVGGADSQLKTRLQEFKEAYEAGEGLPGGVLPFEIEAMPEKLRERIPDIDPIVVRFTEEAINCIKGDCLLSAAFMIGAASEKSVHILIDEYAEAIENEKNRDSFRSRIGKSRLVSHRFEEFRKSYAGSKNKPNEGILAQELDVIIGNVFHFSRITRNEVGHPQIVPDLDKGAILANLGHFCQYVERIFALRDYFRENGVML